MKIIVIKVVHLYVAILQLHSILNSCRVFLETWHCEEVEDMQHIHIAFLTFCATFMEKFNKSTIAEK